MLQNVENVRECSTEELDQINQAFGLGQEYQDLTQDYIDLYWEGEPIKIDQVHQTFEQAEIKCCDIVPDENGVQGAAAGAWWNNTIYIDPQSITYRTFLTNFYYEEGVPESVDLTDEEIRQLLEQAENPELEYFELSVRVSKYYIGPAMFASGLSHEACHLHFGSSTNHDDIDTDGVYPAEVESVWSTDICYAISHASEEAADDMDDLACERVDRIYNEIYGIED
ncbi:MAG: hypothetical protein ABIH67_02630 [Candidatus Uhrbacteria bacterium]